MVTSTATVTDPTPVGPALTGARSTSRGVTHRRNARWMQRAGAPTVAHSARRQGLRFGLAAHAPWPLHRVDLLDLHDELVVATGLPTPRGEPICHWSPGVEVRIGLPHRVTSSGDDRTNPRAPR